MLLQECGNIIGATVFVDSRMELIASIREKNMQIGIVGLGRMGANMARRLMRSKHEVAVYDLKQ